MTGEVSARCAHRALDGHQQKRQMCCYGIQFREAITIICEVEAKWDNRKKKVFFLTANRFCTIRPESVHKGVYQENHHSPAKDAPCTMQTLPHKGPGLVRS